jgi:hypothetical protein
MKFKAGELEIPQENPFENDALKDREEAGKGLTEYIETVETPFVISLNAEWGQGKTTFLKMWKQHLINNDYKVMYFSAWESDYSDDVLTVILTELGHYINENKSELQKVEDIFKDLIFSGGKLLIKAGPDYFKKILPDTGGEIVDKYSDSFCEYFLKKITGDGNNKNVLIEFKKKLEEFAKHLAVINDNKKPFVIIVDELDRCRPSYAIEFLEKIKHLFDVKNILFVVGIDKKEVENFIPAVYGNINCNKYLQRFFDIEFNLPANFNNKYLDTLFKRFDINLEELVRSNEASNCRKVLNDLFKMYELTLREQNLCLSCLAFALKQVNEDKYLYSIILSFLIVFKIKKPELYLRFIKNEVSVIDLMNDFRLHDKEDLIDLDNQYYKLEVMLAICKSGKSKLDPIRETYKSKITTEPENIDRWNYILKELDDNNIRFGSINVRLDQVLKKIELFYNFF